MGFNFLSVWLMKTWAERFHCLLISLVKFKTSPVQVHFRVKIKKTNLNGTTWMVKFECSVFQPANACLHGWKHQKTLETYQKVLYFIVCTRLSRKAHVKTRRNIQFETLKRWWFILHKDTTFELQFFALKDNLSPCEWSK